MVQHRDSIEPNPDTMLKAALLKLATEINLVGVEFDLSSAPPTYQTQQAKMDFLGRLKDMIADIRERGDQVAGAVALPEIEGAYYLSLDDTEFAVSLDRPIETAITDADFTKVLGGASLTLLQKGTGVKASSAGLGLAQQLSAAGVLGADLDERFRVVAEASGMLRVYDAETHGLRSEIPTGLEAVSYIQVLGEEVFALGRSEDEEEDIAAFTVTPSGRLQPAKASSAGSQEDLVRANAQLLRPIEDLLQKAAADTRFSAEDLQALKAAYEGLTPQALGAYDALITGEGVDAAVVVEAEKSKSRLEAMAIAGKAALDGHWMEVSMGQQVRKHVPSAEAEAVTAGAFELVLERTDVSTLQINMAYDQKVRVAREVAGKEETVELSEIEAIGQRYNANLRAIGTTDITSVPTPADSTVAVAFTDEGYNAFETAGFKKIIDMRGFQKKHYLDLATLALVAKGYNILASLYDTDGYADILRNIESTMKLAYKRLTGEDAPDDFLENPVKFVLKIGLPLPTAVYSEGELEQLHMQALMALIAA